MQEFELGDIFNIDETGLFWKLLPDRTLQFKGIACKGGKYAEDRITVLVGASALGEKLPLMVIGKSAKPRCFRNANIPLDYQSNSKASMTSDLFINFIRKLDRKMTISKRKISVIVDNCQSDPRIEKLESIKLIFLPPNTTAFTQPIDADVIKNLKYFYKLELVRRRIAAMENKQNFSINLLQAVCIINTSWEKVTKQTIENCFKHVEFVEGQTFVFDEGTTLYLFEDSNTKISEYYPEVNFTDYLEIDDSLTTTDTITEESIISKIRGDDFSDPSGEEKDVEDRSIEPTCESAAAALKILRAFLECHDDSSKPLICLSKSKTMLQMSQFGNLPNRC